MARIPRPSMNIRESLSGSRISQGLKEMVAHILKQFVMNDVEVAIVGIQTRGYVLAQRLVELLKNETKVKIDLGALDITLYRDDLSTIGIHPSVSETALDFSIDNKHIILVDDVMFTGRTVRAALNELMDFGRPKSIYLTVLIDRGHRELPIEPNFSAITVVTRKQDAVDLHLKEIDDAEEIVISEPIPS
ncbi:MAG: bifunctional pyr operon transcriptional regulator/uracil phosphoribosyltransferase PyrR [Elusimicrobiota bacterium]